ncbi:MAG TPA: cell division protein ZapA [Candidatus Deferrimicrobiaceae bacterium]|jgi:cell division protein ZapA (FtsZ GTPase activity inhibitor)|nr:cell division protein ZapA [Candidatus Deferrimicrobiaceae bacterium]
MGNRIDVNIAGYALTVRTERSVEHMARLAETLNGRVREIQKSGVTANYLNIVMLVAMELADEVLTFEDRLREMREQVETLRREREDLRTRLDRKSRDLLATLDEALK